MEILIMQFFLSSHYLIFSPQHPFSNTFSPCSSLNARGQVKFEALQTVLYICLYVSTQRALDAL
jgi:hypothetical protein